MKGKQNALAKNIFTLNIFSHNLKLNHERLKSKPKYYNLNYIPRVYARE